MTCDQFTVKTWLMGLAAVALAVAGCRAPIQSESNARRHWEYCAITLESASAPERVSIAYFQEGNSRVQRMELRQGPPASVGVHAPGLELADLIAGLGKDGWEMVGRVDRLPDDPLCFYFKRPTD
jgi:hypothetical protein